jgi:hypothetical protein
MTDPELADYLALPHELEGVEFKGPGPRTARVLFAKVVRAVLAMTNRRDGGVVIIGVDEGPNRKPILRGVSDRDLQTWNADDVVAGIAPYADPAVRLRVTAPTYLGLNYVALDIEPFDAVPVLCRRKYPPNAKREDPLILREGALYVRSRRKPESVEVPSQTEMRELIDLATEKRIGAMLGLVDRAGLAIAGRPSASEQFTSELSEPFR